MIRVLHVLNNLGSGGAESIVMNIYRKLDRNKVQFDFLIRSKKNGPLVDEIKSLGGRIYYTSEYPKHFLKNERELKRFFNEHSEYSVIHIHANSLMYIQPLILAKRYRIPCRIIHSHSVTVGSRLSFLKQIHYFNRKYVKQHATHRFACSEAAGVWMFEKDTFEIINNGIDLDRVKFRQARREQIRKKYNLENAFVIGNVGRFSHPKNHAFMIRLFAKYAISHSDARLLLVGDGELFEDIQVLAKKLNVIEKITFAGTVSNVEDYLSAMDVFLFPSLYEGLPVALIEAQAIGLPCVFSNTITSTAILNNNCRCISLDSPMDEWVNALNENNGFIKPSELLTKYDINSVAKELEVFYLEKSGCGKE